MKKFILLAILGLFSIASNFSTGAGGVTDHGDLDGKADDDHTQYTLLAGRSGGQSVTGGTDASDDLTLNSTSDGTKGNILIPDRVDLGTTSPTTAAGGGDDLVIGDLSFDAGMTIASDANSHIYFADVTTSTEAAIQYQSSSDGLIFAYVSGNDVFFAPADIIFNTSRRNMNFYYYGDTNTNVFVIDAGDEVATFGSSTQLGKLGVDGNDDRIQLVIQANGTQTSDLVVFEQSDGTDVFTVNNDGEVLVLDTNTGGNAGTDLCIDANNRLCACNSCA